MRLHIDKTQCDHHVWLRVMPDFLDREGAVAQFRGFERKREDGCYGVVLVREKVPLPVVAHELVHAAMYFTDHFTDRPTFDGHSFEEQLDYLAEVTAYAVEHLLGDYLRCKGESA